MATFTPTRLSQAVLTTTPTDLFTATSTTLVMQIIAANVTGAAATVRVNLVPSGGSADGTNQILPDVTVGAHDVVVLDAWQVLSSGDKINGECAAGSAIVLTTSGLVIT